MIETVIWGVQNWLPCVILIVSIVGAVISAIATMKVRNKAYREYIKKKRRG